MTLKELAHLAHQTLQTRAGCPLKRSHVHELLAAAFGHGSWAAFLSESVLADAGVGSVPDGGLPRLVGRAVQLGYPQPIATTVATTVMAIVSEHGVSAVSWSDLKTALLPARPIEHTGDLDADDAVDSDEWNDLDDALDAEASTVTSVAPGLNRRRLLTSSLLLSSLEHAATPAYPLRHHLLASLLRCARPNPYLHEQSLQGRVLTAIERGWVEDYLRLEPQYRRYKAHLKAAALGGVRAAALEYGTAFEAPEFIAMAEWMTGDIDALDMARAAPDQESRARWLRAAAQQGSTIALEALAEEGDAWAEDQVAAWADDHWLRDAARRAIDAGDALRAWMWQYLAIERGADLTRATVSAYHDGGSRDGQFYDSDFGGPLYADGDVGLKLPDLDRSSHRVAEAKAKELAGRAR